MGKFQVIDKRGRVLEIEDGQPVPDGCKLSVKMTMMDSGGAGAITQTVMANSGDALDLHRPGYRVLNNDSGRAQVSKAYFDSVNDLSNAWKRDAATETKTEGSACRINGKPGKWRSSPGHGFICMPDEGGGAEEIPGTGDAKGTTDARRAAYLQSVRDAESAWRR